MKSTEPTHTVSQPETAAPSVGSTPLLAFGGWCEWNPFEGRALWGGEESHALATVIVGAKGEWMLCDECAALHEFRRFKKRKAIDV